MKWLDKIAEQATYDKKIDDARRTTGGGIQYPYLNYSEDEKKVNYWPVLYYESTDGEPISFSVRQDTKAQIIDNSYGLKGTIVYDDIYTTMYDDENCGGQSDENAQRLKTIEFPYGFRLVASGALAKRRKLEKVVLPSTYQYFDLNAFIGSNSLREIVCYATKAPEFRVEFEKVFSELPEDGGAVYYPKGSDYSSWKKQFPENWAFKEMED